MRVPNYQRQVAYQKGLVQPVQLAAPTRESSGRKVWSDLASLGGILTASGVAVEVLNRVFSKKKKEEEDNSSSSSQAPEEKKPDQPPAEKSAYSGFSSPARQELLAFGRGPALEKTDRASAQSAVDKLDLYAGQHWAGRAAEELSDKNLWVQDYAVLRREVSRLDEEQARQERQEAFEQGASSFVQTAALVRSPQALDSYMQANLAAAESEAKANGITPQQWERQKELLYMQAVRHNLQAALAAGEVDQAQAVYAHFSSKLTPAEQALAQARLNARRADLAAAQAQEAAAQACVEADGEIRESALAAFARETAEAGGLDRGQLQAALQAQLALRQRQDWARRAQVYAQLLAAGPDEAGTSGLMGMPAQTEAEFAHTEKIVRTWQSQPGGQSEPAVFTRLYAAIQAGLAGQADIDEAFAAHALCARDCLQLNQVFCRVRAGETDLRTPLLRGAVQSLCRKYALSEPQMQQAEYWVFTRGTDTAQQLQAAQELKNLLSLQENTK